MLRRPYLWIPLLFVLLFGGAIVGAYTLLPIIVRSQGQAWVETNLPGTLLTRGAIAFDPWTLTLDIADIALADSKAPQAPLVALKVDASLSSLWNGHPRLDAPAVTAPMVDAVLRKDGSINLADLVPPDDGSPVSEIWIGDLSVAGGTIAFTDDRRAQPHKKTLTPVSFTLKDFATRASNGGGFTFDAASEQLKSLYKAKFGKAPKFPDDLPKAGMLAKGEAKAAARTAEITGLETERRVKFAPSDAELAALGQARADAVKQALLGENSIDPTRVFVSTAASVKAKDAKVERELMVK